MGVKIKLLKNDFINDIPHIKGQEFTILPKYAIELLKRGTAKILSYGDDEIEMQVMKNIERELITKPKSNKK